MRDIIERPSDGEVLDTAQIFVECYNETLRRFKVTLSEDAKYSAYESLSVSPGSEADGYDVKTIGGMFSTVITSYNTQIKNDHEFLDIIIYLKGDNLNPITVTANSQFHIEGLPIDNIFIDTPAGYDSLIEVTIFG